MIVLREVDTGNGRDSRTAFGVRTCMFMGSEVPG